MLLINPTTSMLAAAMLLCISTVSSVSSADTRPGMQRLSRRSALDLASGGGVAHKQAAHARRSVGHDNDNEQQHHNVARQQAKVAPTVANSTLSSGSSSSNSSKSAKTVGEVVSKHVGSSAAGNSPYNVSHALQLLSEGTGVNKTTLGLNAPVGILPASSNLKAAVLKGNVVVKRGDEKKAQDGKHSGKQGGDAAVKDSSDAKQEDSSETSNAGDDNSEDEECEADDDEDNDDDEDCEEEEDGSEDGGDDEECEEDDGDEEGEDCEDDGEDAGTIGEISNGNNDGAATGNSPILAANPDGGSTSTPTSLAQGSLSSEKGCTKFASAESGDSCYKLIGTKDDATLQAFYKNNPAVDSECQNLEIGASYCIASA